MKKVLFTFSLLFLAVIGLNNVNAQLSKADAQAAPLDKGAKIEFNKETHDYGDIDQYANGVYDFTFTNTGNEPLIISNAKGSCGCTVPSWPKEPIAPGGTGVISVKYDTNRVGVFGKSVTIQSNAVNEPAKTIRIKGNVHAKAAGEAPLNKTMAPAN